jgi:DNA-binding PadR family transcriptional regulator
MLLGDRDLIENHIIRGLATHGTRTAEQLTKHMKHGQKRVSIQGVYRVLRKLENQNVITKEKRYYSLRISWLLDLLGLVDKMEETYLNDEYLKQLLPTADKKRRTWTFTNLFKMNDVRTHLLLALAKQSEKGISLQYAPHDWFGIMQMKQSQQFKKTFLEKIRASYIVVGGQTFVDQYMKAITINPNSEQVYMAPPEDYIHDKRTIYVDVIDDYVMTLKIDEETAKNIDTLYWSITSEDDMHLLDIFETFMSKVKVKLTIKKDPRAAGSYRKKYVQLFGPLKTLE